MERDLTRRWVLGVTVMRRYGKRAVYLTRVDNPPQVICTVLVKQGANTTAYLTAEDVRQRWEPQIRRQLTAEQTLEEFGW